MEDIIRFMQERFTLDISIYDTSFLKTTIDNRMVVSSCNSTKDYLNHLNEKQSEVATLIESLTNSYSEFFRNPLTFALLKQIIFPKLFNAKEKLHPKEVRIWSAGCAAGQEAYSLAMQANEFINEHHLTTSFRIFATDISDKNLENARQGVYDLKAIQHTSLGLVNAYFTHKGHSYSICDGLKEHINFSRYDVLDEKTIAPPASIFGGFDIIMCCNVLFYYKPAIQKAILNKLSLSLNAGGFFLTGEAEIAILKSDRKFRQFASPSTIFVKA